MCSHSFFSRSSATLYNLIHASYLVYNCVQLNHQHHSLAYSLTGSGERTFMYTRVVHETNFLIHVFMILGVLFGFTGFVFCFIFSLGFFFVSPGTHIEYSTSSYTANKKSKVKKQFIQFLYYFFLVFRNTKIKYSSSSFQSRETSRERTRQDISRRMSSVWCKLQKSLSYLFVDILLWLGSSRMKLLENNFVSFTLRLIK